MGGDAEKFCLRWNDFENNISGAFRELREDKDFFDVTLACDDDQMQAHKVILSACSPFFRTILRRNRHEHPLLYLKGVKYADLVSVLNFMYHGEVNVAQEELNSFLAVAEDLKVKGLTQSNAGKKAPSSLRGNPSKPHFRDPPADPPQHPPTKRPPPRPVQSAPKPAMTHYHHEDDIQDVVPVKSEPVSLPHAVEPSYSTPHDNPAHTGVVADPNMEYGEEYADYGGYEEADESYDTSGMVVEGQAGNKELDDLIANALTRDPVSGEWMCNYCQKTHKNKARISRHAETHFPGFTQQCPHCEHVAGSRNSLRAHVSYSHTAGQDRQQLQPF